MKSSPPPPPPSPPGRLRRFNVATLCARFAPWGFFGISLPRSSPPPPLLLPVIRREDARRAEDRRRSRGQATSAPELEDPPPPDDRRRPAADAVAAVGALGQQRRERDRRRPHGRAESAAPKRRLPHVRHRAPRGPRVAGDDERPAGGRVEGLDLVLSRPRRVPRGGTDLLHRRDAPSPTVAERVRSDDDDVGIIAGGRGRKGRRGGRRDQQGLDQEGEEEGGHGLARFWAENILFLRC